MQACILPSLPRALSLSLPLSLCPSLSRTAVESGCGGGSSVEDACGYACRTHMCARARAARARAITLGDFTRSHTRSTVCLGMATRALRCRAQWGARSAAAQQVALPARASARPNVLPATPARLSVSEKGQDRTRASAGKSSEHARTHADQERWPGARARWHQRTRVCRTCTDDQDLRHPHRAHRRLEMRLTAASLGLCSCSRNNHYSI